MDKLEKSIKYLAFNQKGLKKDLETKVPESHIKDLVRSGFLKIQGEKYLFTERGVDYYSEYVYKEKPRRIGLFGILTRWDLVFD
ncbi:hypothetical protein B6U91_00225 [Candidatus Pacearchaeota archaeon ex4484_71]|nr:MAG: hypothetical protein B6U91_00225 [Candidatus Pacearchaeota archaeon ex4484_71]